MIQVEVINPNQRVRIKKTSNSPYIAKRQLARELGRSPMTVGAWETLLVKYIPDFRDYYQPKRAWNFYQAWCIEKVNSYWESLPRMAPASAIQEFIVNNANTFTQKEYFNELATTINRENAINNSRSIQAA